ncbi:DNA repair and recombination protein RadA [Candidatus Micrarchaeota archaeon]|nr:DNA repair and recombination protein RadA [Candidatus Micrarchaeota archaeon]MBI5229565.1 DNA repair and recombination protein RadA [Candidatus Micrarchaeota archaeon]
MPFPIRALAEGDGMKNSEDEFQVELKGEKAVVVKEAPEKKKDKKITSVSDLPGVGEATASKLLDAGYDSLEVLAVSMPEELAEVAGIGEATAVKIISVAREALEMGYETGDKVLERRKAIARVSTGSKELDALLGGGIETQAITETFGKYSSGKTQLAFQLCVNAQLPLEEGGLAGEVLFIDTENTFRPERIVQIAEDRGLNSDEILKRVHVARSWNSAHQIVLVDKADEMIKKHNIKLMVVDSVTSAFRSDYIGRGTLAERQQKLNKHLHMLQKLADVYNLVVYITNQVMDRPDILFGDPTAPVGGNVLAHQATYRVYLRRSKEDRRIAKLVDSPNLPDGECVFRITTGGLADVE